MKTYLINNRCIYNEEKSELKNIDNSCIVRMTSMRARCLTYIIENAAGGLIEKKKITTELWGERGQFVSDANLTQILYLIRRDLKSLGVSNFFVTIPRLGIKVNDNILISDMTQKQHFKHKRSGLLGFLMMCFRRII